jgi:hypothetical protein
MANNPPPQNVFNFDYAETFDPRVGGGYFAPKGSIFRFIPDMGPAVLLQKQDNGKSTNWTVIGGGGGPPMGNPSDVAFYDGVTGNLTFQDTFKFLQTTNFLSIITTTLGGVFSSTATNAVAFGSVRDAGSSIVNNGKNSLVFGRATNAGTLASLSDDGLVFGQAVTTGTIQANSVASLVAGRADNGGTLQSSTTGCFVFGLAQTGGTMTGSSLGSICFGLVDTTATITTTGQQGCFAGGFSSGGSSITASGNASFAFGIATAGDSHTSAGDGSAVFGQGNTNNSFLGFALGRYVDTTGATSAAWVSTDPLFIIGNGTGSGSLANAYRIDKDGKQTTTGATSNTAVRAAVNPDTLSARTDRSLFVNTSVGAVAFVVNMPAGEPGLEFFVKDIGNNAAVNNITFTPNGGDVMEAGSNITANSGSRHFQFFNGTWWVI